MRKGVIRPRQFGQPSVKDGEYSNSKNLRGIHNKKWFAFLVFLLSALCLMWLFSVGSKETMTVSLNVGKSTSESNVAELWDNSAGDDDEDVDDAEEDTGDSEDQENEQEKTPDDAEDDAEDAEEEEDSQQDSEIDGNIDHDADANAITMNAGNENPTAEMENALPALRGNPVTMSIDSYFLNLGKKVVNISPYGSYKYVLVHARDKQGGGAYIVQGCSPKIKTCKHPDAARVVKTSLTSHGIEAKVLGGGRITRHHLRKSKKSGLISIFGYSRTYGRCEDCNKKACDFIAASNPNYVVRWSNHGYLESDESGIRDFVKCSPE
mmetsp:Transcript_12763/g.20647  ORF Transcript_12763/g.20647 Transcript_12763/m.20647 type:complete len:322 (-) Transcript_12763:545-1510(-)|eukprot:CAMPEP_0203758896 /NCGR_PEP_ID=MMETSP0098-20131031/11776_1 /ASSEMBLY_ACC=CAM_ASM_000208 /TAXON_ID=96639 /ORGANISM=" , Strain NY0313808BC1" /LENGTH=321 /DNA_ID=CAMNT_0050651555 /DNA_START=415 /DNA_END=1377 /DNA_ORIENTATION=+